MTETKNKTNFDINPEEMAKIGLHFGHKTSKINPKMMPYVAGVKNTIHIIDLEKTQEKLEEALKFIQNLISENKILLIVGTKIQVRVLVKNMAQETNIPYVTERWLGGTFTNFDTLKKRVDYFKDLERKKAEGELEKYTKKERIEIDKDIKDLEIKFGGIKSLEKLPDAIFVLNTKKDNIAVKEAKMKGIKVIGVVGTNTDPTLVDFPIPANDDAVNSAKYILEKVKEVIKNAKLKAKSEKQQPKA